MTAFKDILVATDFSQHSAEAGRLAIDLARRYDTALTFVHVFQPVSYVLPEGFVVYSAVQLSEIMGELGKLLDGVKRNAETAGVLRVNVELLQGVPATEIVRFASAKGNGLIVLGTHGRTGIKHALMGSIAEKVVRTASCPVLTVRHREDK